MTIQSPFSVWGCGCNNLQESLRQNFSEGQSFTVPNGIVFLIALETGDLAALTIILPPNPIDQQEFKMWSLHNVAALTISPNTGQTVVGQPNQTFANSSFSLRYNAPDSTWYGG